MNEVELTPAEKRRESANHIMQKYGQYWLVYAALMFTAALSFVSGLVLPFPPTEEGNIIVTLGGVLAAIYYAVGFVTNGEAAANYWFDKLTDHDKDNTVQKVIAWVMLTASIAVSLTTALAAAAQIAYLLGVLAEFKQFPTWAQEWVVWSIPVMWTVNAVAGMAFKSFSDEAENERAARAKIRAARARIHQKRVDAKAKYWEENADSIAERLGRMEAEEEIQQYSIRLGKPANTVGYASQAEDNLNGVNFPKPSAPK